MTGDEIEQPDVLAAELARVQADYATASSVWETAMLEQGKVIEGLRVELRMRVDAHQYDSDARERQIAEFRKGSKVWNVFTALGAGEISSGKAMQVIRRYLESGGIEDFTHAPEAAADESIH